MNIAIIIDAENVLPSHADLIFSHAASLGDIVRKEIYGAASALTSWVAPVLKYAIHPNLTIKAAKGKNSSDIALVIGTMDLLAAGNIDTLIIASSDSDFSSLSIRLRNAGIEVIGMGTEKSNELWRMACSTFVVLQNGKPAQKQQQAAPKQQPAAPAQPQKQPERAQKTSRTAKAAAATHEERMAAIRALIEKRLKGHGGRLQVSTLFPALNQLPEYRVDKQDAGKKPLNYLTSTFADAFHFEEAPDGQSWVSLNGESPAEPVREEAPAVEPEAVMEATEAPEPAPVDVDVETPPETPEQEVDPLKLLTEAGLEEDVARQIVVIFTDSSSLRDAYNRLRTTFGNTAGREYYQKVKEIAGKQ